MKPASPTILRTASDWFWEIGPDLKLTYVSRDRSPKGSDLQRRVGLTSWEAAGVDPDRDPVWARHRDDLLARRPFRDFTYSASASTAGVEHYELSGKPIFGQDGTFLGYRGTAQDISERVKAEKDLERQAAQMSFAGELAKLAYWRESLITREVYWSDQLYRICDRDPDDFKPTFDNRFFDLS